MLVCREESMSDELTNPPMRQPLTVPPDPQREAARKAAEESVAARDAAKHATPAPTTDAKTFTPLEKKLLEGKVIKAIRQIYDPEIPVNIYDLGLIYGIDVDDTGGVRIRMTLTAPACPVAGSLPGDVEARVESIREVRSATVDLVWELAWS